jgi:dienelactone hydrolase
MRAHLVANGRALTMRKVAGILLAVIATPWALAAELPWNTEALFKPPAMHAAEGFDEPGCKAVYYEGAPLRGKPVRVFAWYGAPEGAGTFPAMVLVHGGGGTAFAEWVRLWTARGYAAIAMDTCGSLPRGEYNKWERDPQGGPPGWGGLDQIGAPVEDQWSYHAVADVVLAHSLIRSFPEVDADRTGITGISWGGYLTCIAAGVDPRFKLAVPVYGCGFLGENSAWVEPLGKLPKESADRWLALWDPSVYLPRAAMPILWVTGTNDFAFPMDSLQKSYRQPTGPRTLAIRVRMPHGHGGAGEKPEEIHAYADSILKNGAPLPRITGQGRDGDKVWAAYTAAAPIARAELLYTKATGKWQDRLWESAPADVDPVAGRVSAALPKGTTVYYLNVIDAADRVVSAEHEALGG